MRLSPGAMLRSKVAVPLLKGARAVFAAGATHSSRSPVETVLQQPQQQTDEQHRSRPAFAGLPQPQSQPQPQPQPQPLLTPYLPPISPPLPVFTAEQSLRHGKASASNEGTPNALISPALLGPPPSFSSLRRLNASATPFPDPRTKVVYTVPAAKQGGLASPTSGNYQTQLAPTSESTKTKKAPPSIAGPGSCTENNRGKLVAPSHGVELETADTGLSCREAEAGVVHQGGHTSDSGSSPSAVASQGVDRAPFVRGAVEDSQHSLPQAHGTTRGSSTPLTTNGAIAGSRGFHSGTNLQGSTQHSHDRQSAVETILYNQPQRHPQWLPISGHSQVAVTPAYRQPGSSVQLAATCAEEGPRLGAFLPSSPGQADLHVQLPVFGPALPRPHEAAGSERRDAVRPSHGDLKGGKGHVHQFHITSRKPKLGPHHEVVGDVIAALRKMHSDAHGSLDLALKPWKGALNPYHMCDVLKQQRDPRLAMDLFQWYKSQARSKNDVFLYTTLIVLMGRTKNIAAVEQLFKEMQDEGCEPSLVTYNSVMHAYGKANLLDEAKAVFDHMSTLGKKLDTVSYGTLIDLYSKAGRHKDAIDIFNKMKSSGLKGDVVSYSMLISSFGRIGDLVSAAKLFQEMSTKGIPPNHVTYNTMIDLYGKGGRYSTAIKLFQEMKDSGLKCDRATYSAMINLCGKAGYYAEAEAFFTEMEDAGIQADAIAYSILVDMWGKAGQPKRAGKWFRTMIQAGLTPSPPAFNALMHAYLKMEMYSETKHIFETMLRGSVIPNLKTYTLLLSSCTDCAEQNGVDICLELMACTGHPVHSLVKLLLQVSKDYPIIGMCQYVIVDLQANCVPSFRITQFALVPKQDTADPSEEDAMMKQVGQFMEQIKQHEEHESRRAFTDSLISFLYQYGRRERAARVWREANYLHMFPSAFRGSDNNLWSLDLHYMSPGTAMTAVKAELSTLRERAMSGGLLPQRLEIITGWGRRSRIIGTSFIKKAVEDLLDGVGSPFRMDVNNVGCLYAHAPEVLEWLVQPELDRILAARNFDPP
eukprot:SM000097S24824  [mRNA]  locus=s97:511049:515602:- [translate_table: standard]